MCCAHIMAPPYSSCNGGARLILPCFSSLSFRLFHSNFAWGLNASWISSVSPVGRPLRWKHVHAQSFTASGYSRKTNKLRYFCSQKPLRVPNCLVIRLDPLLTPFYVGVFISQTPEHTHTVPLQSGRRSRVNKQKSCLPHCLLA